MHPGAGGSHGDPRPAAAPAASAGRARHRPGRAGRPSDRLGLELPERQDLRLRGLHDRRLGGDQLVGSDRPRSPRRDRPAGDQARRSRAGARRTARPAGAAGCRGAGARSARPAARSRTASWRRCSSARAVWPGSRRASRRPARTAAPAPLEPLSPSRRSGSSQGRRVRRPVPRPLAGDHARGGCCRRRCRLPPSSTRQRLAEGSTWTALVQRLTASPDARRTARNQIEGVLVLPGGQRLADRGEHRRSLRGNGVPGPCQEQR